MASERFPANFGPDRARFDGRLVGSAAVAKSLKGTGTVIVHDGGGSMASPAQGLFEPFEAETGIRVIHQAGVPAGVQRAAIMAGAPKHDVANISGGSLDASCTKGC